MENKIQENNRDYKRINEDIRGIFEAFQLRVINYLKEKDLNMDQKVNVFLVTNWCATFENMYGEMATAVLLQTAINIEQVSLKSGAKQRINWKAMMDERKRRNEEFEDAKN